MLEQSTNIASIYSGSGKFRFTDAEDDRQDFMNEIEYFKRKGMLN